jgi:predicted permease
MATNIQISGEEIPDPGHVGLALQTIGAGALRLLGVPVIRGREFTARDDTAGAPPVALVNESFARRIWPGYPDSMDPVGRRLTVPILDNQVFEIVGVAADVRQGGPRSPAPPQFYLPTAWYPPQAAYLAVRGRTDPRSLVSAIRAEVLAVDADQALADVRMMREMLDASVGQQHVAARLMAFFAAAALLLVVVGIYGLLAYTVVQRTQEIGIRRAFGAQRHDVLRTVVGQGLRLTLAGVACGLAGAAAFTRLMASLLFEVSPTDPMTFTAVGVLFVVIAALATLVPAWRAVRIDPMTALRV